MTSQKGDLGMGNGLKTCVICGEDCAGQPRIKDKKGRYYHKTCYEQAKAKKASPAPPVEAALKPLAIEGDEPGGFDPFGDLADSPAPEAPPVGANACPSCGNALQSGSVLCMNCGYNQKGGKQVSTKVGKPKKVRDDDSGGGPGIANLIKNPLVVSATYVITMLLMMLALKASPDNVAVGGIFALVYLLMSLSIGIGILIDAFRESIATGFLTLCIPFYILYFVFGVSESAWVKYMFTANILVQILFVVLIRGAS